MDRVKLGFDDREVGTRLIGAVVCTFLVTSRLARQLGRPDQPTPAISHERAFLAFAETS
jgi:hypothetical protein